MITCIHFLGNLINFFGEKICFDQNTCRSIKEVIIELVRKNNLPIDPEFLVYIDEKGSTLDPKENICEHKSIYVLKVLQGGSK